MGCSHTSGKWVIEGEEDWDGNIVENHVYEEFSTLRDIDLHRMKCTQCGKIEYYSSAARSYYEEGKPSIYIGG